MTFERELWNIFTHYTLHGHPRDPSKLTCIGLIKLCRDIMVMDVTMTEKPITQANVVLIFTAQVTAAQQAASSSSSSAATSTRAPRTVYQEKPTVSKGTSVKPVKDNSTDKMGYNDFLGCLMKIAEKCYPSATTPEECMQQLLMDNLLPFASRRVPYDISTVLKKPTVETLYKYYEDSLTELFRFYATASDQVTKKKQLMNSTRTHSSSFEESRREIEAAKSSQSLQNSMANHVGYSDFVRFTSDFGLSGTGLTVLDVGDIYLSVISSEHTAFTPGIRKMNFDEFWEAIVRCALCAYKNYSISTEDKIKGLFLFIWRFMQSRVSEELKVHKQTMSSSAGEKAGLLRGSQLLNERIVAAWTKDGYRDYLDPNATPASSLVTPPPLAQTSVLHKLIKQSKEGASMSDMEASKKLIVNLEVGDYDDLGDDRIKPSQLRILLQKRPDIASLLHSCLKDEGISSST